MPEKSCSPRLPDLLERIATDEGLLLSLGIQDSNYYFQGHYPDYPILPAVTQVDWAIRFGAELGYQPIRFSGIVRLKFQQPIRPNEIVTLSLQRAGTGLQFEYRNGEKTCSRGVIQFNA